MFTEALMQDKTSTALFWHLSLQQLKRLQNEKTKIRIFFKISTIHDQWRYVLRTVKIGIVLLHWILVTYRNCREPHRFDVLDRDTNVRRPRQVKGNALLQLIYCERCTRNQYSNPDPSVTRCWRLDDIAHADNRNLQPEVNDRGN